MPNREDKKLFEHPKNKEFMQSIFEGINNKLVPKKEYLLQEIEFYSDELKFINKYLKTKLPNLSPEAWGNEGMHAFILGEKLKNPSNGKDADWTDVRQFNLMLNTHL